MSDSNRTIIGIFVALVVIVVAAVGWWLLTRDDSQPPEVVEEPTPAPAPTPTPSLEERLSERLSGTTLSGSDAVVRELAAGLSSNPKLAAWLVNEDLIRRFTASVDNIASGLSPLAHLEFLRPKAGFEVDKWSGGGFVIDPASYRRYDLPAQVFASLDTEGTVALYQELKPLIDEAYAEIGPPNRTFDGQLETAFDQLLAVPVLTGPARVDQLVLTYAWADDELEGLSSAQRHLLRMGPENVSLIQAKLRELRAALAAPTAPVE
jgi:hypothetical protein